MGIDQRMRGRDASHRRAKVLELLDVHLPFSFLLSRSKGTVAINLLLALAGKASSDLRAVISQRLQLLAEPIREMDGSARRRGVGSGRRSQMGISRFPYDS